MKPIVEKVLKGGLIDKSVAELMEKWGNLPPGAADMVNEDALKNATKDHITKLAEDLATEVEKEHKIRETALDLNRIRWPAVVSICTPERREELRKMPGALLVVGQDVAVNVATVVDRMGRYYFRAQDSNKDWFVTGFYVQRRPDGVNLVWERIMEAQPLFIDDTMVCWQVSTMKEV